MKMKTSVLTFILCAFLLVSAIGAGAKSHSKFLSVRAVVIDNCLLASVNGDQSSTNFNNGEGSNFSMLCNITSPYKFSIEDQSGKLLSTLVVADDGFGYQYHMTKEGSDTYFIETCDSLVDVPETPGQSTVSKYYSGNGQVSLGTPDNVTIRINW